VAGGRSVGISLEERIHWPSPCGRVCTNKRSLGQKAVDRQRDDRGRSSR
jgi:hypothetical protein